MGQPARRRRGRDPQGAPSVGEAQAAVGRAYSSLGFEVERLEEHGDSVGVITEILYRGRGSGIEVAQRMGMLFTIREGN